jgi:hypothetical protein
MKFKLFAISCPFLFVGLCLGAQNLGNATKVVSDTYEGDRQDFRSIEVSDQFFGMHTLSPGKDWPSVAFGAVRPAGVTWGALEPARDQFNWQSLDFWIQQSQSHGVQFDYVFLNVPAWASTRPEEPCVGKRLGCAAPPNLDDWDNFVRALVTRYKGRITSYELWNEPNAGGYWTGTPEQMVQLAAHAYPIIKSIDPAALVTTPAASSTGWPLAHDAWMEQYLAAGGGKYADVVAWHGYSGRNDRPALPPEQLLAQIDQLRKVLSAHHLEHLPLWNTEGGWGRNTQLPDDAHASFLMRWYLLQITGGVARAYWYQWDNPEWGTLWREDGGLRPAGQAYTRLREWVAGTTAVRPCRQRDNSGLWTCDLKKGSEVFRAAWSTTSEVALPESRDVEFYFDISGEKHPAGAKPVMVGPQPVFIKLKSSSKREPMSRP